MPRVGESLLKPKVGNNREYWLTELALHVETLMVGIKLAPYRLTCGWPSRHGLGRKIKVLGECHSEKSSASGVHEIFISPILDKPLEVSGTVCHEMIHVAAGIASQHKGAFVRICKRVGLTKNPPRQAMPGPELEERLARIIDRIGPYPHQALIPQVKVIEKPKSDLSLICPACECVIRMTTKWFLSVGAPTCGCGEVMTPKE
jgi:hypothetical protein